VTLLVGIDCATDPRKVGLARAELADSAVVIRECLAGSRSNKPVDIVSGWLASADSAVIALDAPLGWPEPLAPALSGHLAGQPVGPAPNTLFRRFTDDEMYRRLEKRPLDVGADRIARTAVAALTLLDAIRGRVGLPIPLAWQPAEDCSLRAIEVYPAATRLGHGAPDKGGSLVGLDKVLRFSPAPSAELSRDAIDAAVCALAAADFLRGDAIPPDDLQLAEREGWIWAPAGRPTMASSGRRER